LTNSFNGKFNRFYCDKLFKKSITCKIKKKALKTFFFILFNVSSMRMFKNALGGAVVFQTTKNFPPLGHPPKTFKQKM